MKKQFFVPNEITSNFDRADYPFPDSEVYAIAFKTDINYTKITAKHKSNYISVVRFNLNSASVPVRKAY